MFSNPLTLRVHDTKVQLKRVEKVSSNQSRIRDLIQDLHNTIREREQELFVVLDKYGDVAQELGLPTDNWYGDPLCTHEELMKTLKEKIKKD
jgi:hypothetical protein